MAEQYRHLMPNDFDKYDCVKLSKWYFVCLAFMLRGYLIWVFSVSNFRDTASIISIIYPQPQIFYIHLITGIPAIMLLILLTMRRPNATGWVKQIWPHSRMILQLCLVFDLLMSFLGYWFIHRLNFEVMLAHTCLVIMLLVFIQRSKRITINLSEFPEPVPEK